MIFCSAQSNATKTYFIFNKSTQQLKIGRSIDPDKRLLTLQTGSGMRLVLLGIVDGDFERELHAALKEYRQSGEWFRWCRELRAVIREHVLARLPNVNSTAKTDTVSNGDHTAESLEDIMDLINEEALAKHLNVQVKTLQAWRCRGGGPEFIRVGRLVRYKPEDVQTWIELRRVTSTSVLV